MAAKYFIKSIYLSIYQNYCKINSYTLFHEIYLYRSTFPSNG
jgi:hypothetical protein